MTPIQIGTRTLREGHAFIIAELSANHLGDLDLARRTIKAMAESGADAVKLQTYTADTITLDCRNEYFDIKGTIWEGQNLHDLYRKAYTPWEWHAELQKLTLDLGLEFLSSPFDPTSVDFLDALDVPCFKIASFEITDIPLIKYVAAKGKPVIMSTGIAGPSDIEEAVAACRSQGNDQIILLKCTSAYPAPIEQTNLRAIPELARRFGVLCGLSDHTLGHIVPVAAVAQGAVMIEKHFILDKSLGGPDASFSMDPADFTEMVQAVRLAESALGTSSLEPTEKALAGRQFSRSLFISADIRKGEVLTPDNVRSVRPGAGMHPRHLPEVLGMCATSDLSFGTPLSWDLIC